MRNKKLHSSQYHQLRFTAEDREDVIRKIEHQELNQDDVSSSKRLRPIVAMFVLVPAILVMLIANVFTNTNQERNALTGITGSGQEDMQPVQSIVWIFTDIGNRGGIQWLTTYHHELKEMKLVSLDRDTFITVEDTNGEEIETNMATAGTAPTQLLESLTQLFEIPIDSYVTVEMDHLVEMIEEKGGLAFDFSHDLEIRGVRGNQYSFTKGMNKLNGEEVLSLLLYTHNGIWNEGEQQYLLKELVNKIFHEEPLTSLLDDMKNTNLTTSELQSMNIETIEVIPFSYETTKVKKEEKHLKILDREMVQQLSKQLQSFE